MGYDNANNLNRFRFVSPHAGLSFGHQAARLSHSARWHHFARERDHQLWFASHLHRNQLRHAADDAAMAVEWHQYPRSHYEFFTRSPIFKRPTRVIMTWLSATSAVLAPAGIASLAVIAPPPDPIILTQPKSQIFNEGDSVTLTVGAGGTSPIAYQWHLNDVDLPGATQSNFNLFQWPVNECGKLYRHRLQQPWQHHQFCRRGDDGLQSELR